MTEKSPDAALDILRSLAPGAPLRAAIELILRQDTGALIVLGTGSDVDAVSSGGFDITPAVPFSPARLAELAKMDGAVLVDEGIEHIYRANVHLIPDSSIETSETGTRHRTAERVARQTGNPVVVVSEGRSTATLYTLDGKYELQSPTSLMAQANQDLQSLERFRQRLHDAEERLTRLEVDDIVLSRDVVLLLQRAALVQRIGADLERYAVELGGDGNLLTVQVADLLDGVARTAELVYADYGTDSVPDRTQQLAGLDELATEELYDPHRVASMLELGPLDHHARPRGYRILGRVPRLPENVEESLVEHFGDFQKMLHATAGELDQVEGVGRARAQQLRRYLDRLLEATHVWIEEE
ncbi:MAG: DNA integrity scanning diadenylate cyclase DisA [Acidimicrobiia bacterium]